jgi:hypothetical protein
MTESERDLLMPFLRQLVNTRTTPGDDAASNLINAALRKQPNACYLLVQRALSLEHDLAVAQRRINELEGKEPPKDTGLLRTDFLNTQTSGWGEQGDHNHPATTSKRLYDFFKQAQSPEKMDFESRAVSYIEKHSGRIWLGILAMAAMVVLVKETIL